MTTQAHLEKRCTWSMQERVDEFRVRFPGCKMNRWKLAAIYRKSGIKRKVLKKRVRNPSKYTADVLSTLTVQCRASLVELNERGFEVFQVDESVFNA